jgi:hypothetical protein
MGFISGATIVGLGMAAFNVMAAPRGPVIAPGVRATDQEYSLLIGISAVCEPVRPMIADALDDYIITHREAKAIINEFDRENKYAKSMKDEETCLMIPET